MRAVAVFTMAYVAAMVAYGISVDSPLTYIYAGITALVFVTFAVIHRWARFPLSIWWVISGVMLVNMIGGVALVGGRPMYVAGFVGPLPFDKVFHAAAAFAFAFVAWHMAISFAGSGFSRGGMMVVAFLMVMGGGAVVEIAELIGTAISEVSVGDYGNNALDLVANAVGALIGLVVVALMDPRAVGRSKDSNPF